MHKFANPGRFIRFSERITPWVAVLCLLLLAFGLYEALLVSPPDYQQGEAVRIMYVHVPAAWMATLIYLSMAAGSASFLIWRHPLGDVLARASAPIGAGFTAITLITGSLWGKPMWGAWWVWDARTVSMLVLLFLYFGLFALRQALPSADAAGRACAVLTIVGLVNIPIIKYSVDWWLTLHQPSSKLLTAPTMPSEMYLPLLTNILGMYALFGFLMLSAMRLEVLRREERTKWVQDYLATPS